MTAALLLPPVATAQQVAKPSEKSRLDVTMQVLTDPDAELPAEIVRQIPLPARRQDTSRPDGPSNAEMADDAPGTETAEQASDAGQELAEQAQEAAQHAGEEGRSIADEAERRSGPPMPLPEPPPLPPRGP